MSCVTSARKKKSSGMIEINYEMGRACSIHERDMYSFSKKTCRRDPALEYLLVDVIILKWMFEE
jgi:hypothetical protein